MKEKWLDAAEYQKPGQFSVRMKYDSAMFPFEYPLLNHPSTILLVKAPFGTKEATQVPPASIVQMNDMYRFLPSFSLTFTQSELGALSCDADLPLVEIQLSSG